MNRIALAILAGTFCAASAAAQSGAGAQAGSQSSSQTEVHAAPQGAAASSSSAANAATSAQAGSAIAGGTTFNAELIAPVDSKKAKPGDAVTARTTEAVKPEGRTVLPKGTKLVGHVTRASARGKGEAESTLGIVFDKAVLKNGQEVPVNLAIQALAQSQTNAAATTSELDSATSAGATTSGRASNSGGRVLNGVGGPASAVGTVTNTAANAEGTVGGTVNSTTNTTSAIAGSSQGAVGGLNSAGKLSSDSRGVFGLNGLNLNSAVSNGTQGSVITSAGKNVHLDSGTRMLLVSETAAAMTTTTPNPE